MGHHSCCNQQKVKRGLWSPEEDEKLIRYITTYGYGCWSEVPEKAGSSLSPSLHHGNGKTVLSFPSFIPFSSVTQDSKGVGRVAGYDGSIT